MATRDYFPGVREEEEIQLLTEAGDPAAPGGMKFDGAAFRLRDAAGTFDPRSGGAGLSEAAHQALDTQVHLIAEDNETVVTRASGRVTNVTVWNVGQTLKIRETIITRTSNQVSQIQTIQYDGAGAVKSTYTRTVTRSGGQVDELAGALT